MPAKVVHKEEIDFEAWKHLNISALSHNNTVMWITHSICGILFDPNIAKFKCLNFNYFTASAGGIPHENRNKFCLSRVYTL